MKLTRRQLIRLIKEAMIKPEIPNLDTDEYEQALDLARHADSSIRNVADDLANTTGYEGNFSDALRQYDTGGRITFERVGTVGSGLDTSTGEKEVSIPYDLVDAVIDAHQQVIQHGRAAVDNYLEAVRAVYSHIDREVEPDYVDQYALETSGYRAQEYSDAMNALGELEYL